MATPVASFSADGPTTGDAPWAVSFTDTSTGTPTSWSWEKSLDNATWTPFSTSQNPSTSFAAGVWSIRLSATNSDGTDEKIISGYVVSKSTTPPPPPPPNPAPQLYTETAEDTFDYETEWKEYIGNESPTSSTFDRTKQQTTLTGWIPANKKRSALKFFLGYAYAEDTAPYALHRELPARHPVFPNLYAYDASFADIEPKPGDDEIHGLVPGTWKESPFEGSKEETMYYADYEKTIMTVQYKSFGRMRFLPDSDIGDYRDEYKRFTLFNTEPSVEALSADGSSQLIFREGGGGNQPVVDQTAFPAPVAELMGKVALTITWVDVPHNYLSLDPDICTLDKILGRFSTGDTPANRSTWKYPPLLGTVNSDFFLGYYPGTILFRAVKVEEMMYPVTTADPYEVAGGYTLMGVFEHFDPIKGIPYSPASPYRGHRIFPWRQDGRWYYATREGGEEMLPLADHWKFFQNANDPT